METLTETIITDSSMIGHNPSTPAGAGQAVGKTLDFERIREGVPGTPYIVFAKAAVSYEEIAEVINRERKRLTITGVILQADEAVLVENRLEEKVPIIDEVAGIQKLPDDVLAAIEVAALASEAAQKHLEGNAPKKLIVVPGRLVNIVV